MSTYAVVQNSNNICDNVILWDDTQGSWTPPADHYAVNIDGQFVTTGYYYDQSTQTWTAPPVVMASFSPSPIFLSQTTTLTWTTENATSVTVAGAVAALNGSQDFTPDKIGKFSVTVTATGLAGTTSMTATVNVVATQAELVN